MAMANNFSFFLLNILQITSFPTEILLITIFHDEYSVNHNFSHRIMIRLLKLQLILNMLYRLRNCSWFIIEQQVSTSFTLKVGYLEENLQKVFAILGCFKMNSTIFSITEPNFHRLWCFVLEMVIESSLFVYWLSYMFRKYRWSLN